MPWLTDCSTIAIPNIRGWNGIVPSAPNVGAINMDFSQASIQTESPLGCVYSGTNVFQGWAVAVIEDSLGDTGTNAVLTRQLGFYNTAGAFTANWSIPVGWSIRPCGATDQTALTVEVTRLAGTIPGLATFEPIGGPTTPTVGDHVTVAAGYRSLSWHYNRATLPDDGSATISSVTVGELTYLPGSGPSYIEDGMVLSADGGQTFTDPLDISVTGEAYIELIVIR